MKISSFKKFLEEEDSKAIIQTGLNCKSIDNKVTKEIINSRLINVTSNPFLTPYIALGNVARVLAYANIVVPQYTFLDREEGEVVFDATQFGQLAGVNLDGSPAKSEVDHFIYFSYTMNDDGYYDCFAALVDSDELEKMMDMGGDEDVDQFDVHQNVDEEAIDELDMKKIKGAIAAATIGAAALTGAGAHAKSPEKPPQTHTQTQPQKPSVQLPMAPSHQFGKTKVTPTHLMDPDTGKVTPIGAGAHAKSPEKPPQTHTQTQPQKPSIQLPMAPSGEFGKIKVKPTHLVNPDTGEVTKKSN